MATNDLIPADLRNAINSAVHYGTRRSTPSLRLPPHGLDNVRHVIDLLRLSDEVGAMKDAHVLRFDVV